MITKTTNQAVDEREKIVRFILRRMDELENGLGSHSSSVLIRELNMIVGRLRNGVHHDN